MPCEKELRLDKTVVCVTVENTHKHAVGCAECALACATVCRGAR